VYGNFSAPKAQEIIVSRGKTLELLRPDDSGRLQTVYTVEMFACIRSLAPFRLTGATRDFLIVGSDSGRIVILEYVKEQGHFRKVHQETFGKSGCRRIVPGQFLAVDPKGRACMIGAHPPRACMIIAHTLRAYVAGQGCTGGAWQVRRRAPSRRGLTVDREGGAQPAAPVRRRTARHARRVLQRGQAPCRLEGRPALRRAPHAWRPGLRGTAGRAWEMQAGHDARAALSHCVALRSGGGPPTVTGGPLRVLSLVRFFM
jgi:hypothetical protein